MTGAAEPVGTLEVALAHAAKLLKEDPALAAEQAQEILKAMPGQGNAMLILALAERQRGRLQPAIENFRQLCVAQPAWAAPRFELALSLAAAGQGSQAIDHLRHAVRLQPDFAEAWRVLADHLTAIGEAVEADRAYLSYIRCSTKDPQLLQAGSALIDNRIGVAEAVLKEYLKQHPTDVAGIRMLAEVAARLGRYPDAEALLQRCLQLSPSFTPARHNLAFVQHRLNKSADALTHLDVLLARDARNPAYRNLRAAILSRIGEYEAAIDLYRAVLADYPQQAKVWMSFGHALKTAGRQDEAVQAYRKAVEYMPQLGEAYWSLANLKTFRFSDTDVAAMQAQLQRKDLSIEDRFHFEFALGKSHEDGKLYDSSFQHYRSANELRRSVIRYDAKDTTELVRRSKALFTRDFFVQREHHGCLAPDPIFIVGLPRAGSTLVEQILATHPQVEGTMELPDLISIARDLSGRSRSSDPSQYPEILASLAPAQLRQLGERYLEQTRIQRKTERPFFIDKMPNNWAYVGLIHLILPNAKIVDARRHPLGCCFSAYKQHFARGQHYTYDLRELGWYYRDYVELAAHIDAVLPGRVHRVIYETMVDDTEREIRRLLDYCALDFDERCLRFYENERAVRTASSEQVRRPIYREGVEQWRHYEAWLDPLQQALGPVLDRYPEAPVFD